MRAMMGFRKLDMLIFSLFVTASVSTGIVCAQEYFQYNSHGKRDPFIPLITGEKAATVTLKDVKSVDEIKLEGLATGARGEPMAILNGSVVKEKGTYGSVTVRKIDKNGLKILINGIEYKLDLRKGE